MNAKKMILQRDSEHQMLIMAKVRRNVHLQMSCNVSHQLGLVEKPGGEGIPRTNTTHGQPLSQLTHPS